MSSLTAIVGIVFVACVSQAVPLDIGGRIINGTDADIRDVPYMVSYQDRGFHECGASILDEYNVLTAAHCIYGLEPELGTVLYGTANRSDTVNHTVQVEALVGHQGFVYAPPYLYDLAILQLASPLPLSDTVRPVRLPQQNASTPENATAVLNGWGMTVELGTAKILQTVALNIYSDDECERIHKEDGPTDRSFQICAGLPEGGKGQCSGDSGGPLVVDGEQVGIVSWSNKPCAQPNSPGVFTKVSSYLDWINNNRKRVA